MPKFCSTPREDVRLAGGHDRCSIRQACICAYLELFQRQTIPLCGSEGFEKRYQGQHRSQAR